MSDKDREIDASPEESDSKSKSEYLFKEYINRRESGETISPEDYIKEHPEFETDFMKLFNSIQDTPFSKSKLFASRPFNPSQFEIQMVTDGQVIGDFKLIKLIAQGGMGQVWEANQVSENRKVALKIIKPDRVNSRSLELFAREARAGGRLDHPGIVTMYAHGEAAGIQWIAMELVEGNCTIRNVLDEISVIGKLPADYYRKVAVFLADLVSALQAAHEGGVIHRDLKPQNILITSDEKPKITDFGLARITDESAISRTGDFAGTYHYMSPEQVTAGRIEIDHRTDIFSLGVVFYEMLALRRPFEGDTTHQVYEQIVTQDPPNLLEIRSRVPKELVIICGKALEKRRSHRYQSMREFGLDLNHFLKSEPIKAKAPGMIRRTKKWVYRHPIVSVSSALVAAALVVISFLFVYAQSGWSRAEQQRDIAEDRYNEIMRLSDVKRLSDLEADAEMLWPAYPITIHGLEEWLTRADEVLGRLDEHQQTLAFLRENALTYGEAELQKDRETHPQWEAFQALKESKSELEPLIASLESGTTTGDKSAEGSGEEVTSIDPDALKEQLSAFDTQISELEVTVSERRTWTFENMETQWQHDMVAGLVSGLEAFSSKDEGLLKNVQERLAFATTVETKSIDDHQTAWDEAIASIADKEESPIYNGLVIEPKVGFVPIGRDPASGLWEFAHLQTGEIPERGSDGKLVLTEEMGLVFVLIPGGTFNMGAVRPSENNPEGSPNVDPDALPNEGPVHEVNLKPFYLSKYEMTQSQWLRFTGKNPSSYGPESKFKEYQHTLLHPVEQMSWQDCSEVLFRLDLRFPTESEWEYAARAGTSTVFWTGNERESLQGVANIADSYLKNNGGANILCEAWLDDGFGFHSPVGTYLPNAFGLHDIIGNLWEWCEDIFSESYKNTPTDGSANKKGSPFRIYRGGSWGLDAFCNRVAIRGNIKENLRVNIMGLRPASFCKE